MANVGDPLHSPRPDLTGAAERADPSRPFPTASNLPVVTIPDGFQSSPAGGNVADQLRGTAQPVRSPDDLHPLLERVASGGDIPARFAADLALVLDQLMHPRLATLDGIARVFRFFSDYAEKYVRLRGGQTDGHDVEQSHEGTSPLAVNVPLPSELRVAFVTALEEAGFAAWRDQATGRNGVNAALDLVTAPSTSELRRRAENIELVPLQPRPEAHPLPPATPQKARPERVNEDEERRRENAPFGGLTYWGASVLGRLRQRLDARTEEAAGRLDLIFWVGIVLLCGFVVVGLVLRYLL